MTIVSVRDVLRSIARSLQVSTSIPAIIFVLINAYFIFPAFFKFDLTGLEATTLIISVSLVLSYLFQSMNYPMIRLLEGYKLQERRPLFQMRKYQRAILESKQQQLVALDKRIADLSSELPADIDQPGRYSRQTIASWPVDRVNALVEWRDKIQERAAIRALLEANFPSNERAVLATRLGNVIAAFEEYPYTRYGMDSIALWPRLLPILRKSTYMDFVVQEKSTFDFLLYMLVVVIVLGIELAYLQAFIGSLLLFFLIIALTVFAVAILYQALVVSARQWGITVRVAFDLHRDSLFSAFRLKRVNSFDEERQTWRLLSAFIVLRQAGYPMSILEAAGTTSHHTKVKSPKRSPE